MSADINYVKCIIPDCYRVQPSKEKEGSIHCVSTGTNQGMDDNQFDHFMSFLNGYFGDRLQEVYHHVNHEHQDFTIYLKPNPDDLSLPEEEGDELFNYKK